MAADSPIIGYALTQTNGQLERFGDVYDAAPQGIAVAKSDTALADVIHKAMARTPAQRYKNVVEFRHALLKAGGEEE